MIAVNTMTRRLLAGTCSLALTLSLSLPARASFSDVEEGRWYKPYTDKAVEAGLMRGVEEDRFQPGGNLTLAQTLVLAYQLHSRYGGEAALPEGEGPWYMPYYAYCTQQGILTGDRLGAEELGRNATRFELVDILDRALPSGELAPINDLPDGFVPDVAEGDPFGGAVYRWYRAGALAGDGEHRFHGESPITRAEVAVLLCQLTGLVERVKLGQPSGGTAAPGEDDGKAETPGTEETPGKEEPSLPGDPAGDMLKLVNEARAKEGLRPFVSDPNVAAAAQSWAQERAKGDTGDRSFANALDEAGVRSKGAAGINAGQGYATAEEALGDWMGTETMRGRVLSQQFTTVGVGFVPEAKQWVMLFIEG